MRIRNKYRDTYIDNVPVYFLRDWIYPKGVSVTYMGDLVACAKANPVKLSPSQYEVVSTSK